MNLCLGAFLVQVTLFCDLRSKDDKAHALPGGENTHLAEYVLSRG